MSSVGDLLMVVCDKLYIPYVCISSYWEFGIMSGNKNWRRLTAGMYTAN